MRRRLRATVMEEFQRLVKDRFPDFSLVQVDPAAMELVFENSVSGNFSLYISVFTLKRSDEFDIDLAWSETPVWSDRPEFPRHISAMMPSDPPDAGGVRFRIHWLKPDPSPDVVGWDLAPTPELDDFEGWLAWPPTVEELLPRVPAMVRDAVDTLIRLGLPYFERVLAARDKSG